MYFDAKEESFACVLSRLHSPSKKYGVEYPERSEIGLPQGCASSAILFIIAEEPLLCAAKNRVSQSSSHYRTKDRNVLSDSLDSELRLDAISEKNCNVAGNQLNNEYSLNISNYLEKRFLRD